MASGKRNGKIRALLGARAVFVRLLGGRRLGKRYPVLWRAYDFLHRHLASDKTYYHELAGSKFLVDFKDPDWRMRRIMEEYIALSVYEPETSKLVQTILKPGDTFVDVGASIGYFTMLASKLVGPKGTVIAVEPTEMNFNYLCENTVANSATNVMPFKIAAWDKKEPVRMPMNAVRPVWANGMTLDDLLADYPTPKLIKVDVDGAEPWVLRGMKKTLRSLPHLIIEYYPRYIERAGGDPVEALDILRRNFSTVEEIPGDYGEG